MLYLRLLVAALFASVRARRDLVLENLALRHQLAVYTRGRRRPRLRRHDRRLWSLLARGWSGWRGTLVMVEPDTVVRWHRSARRAYWRWKSALPRALDTEAPPQRPAARRAVPSTTGGGRGAAEREEQPRCHSRARACRAPICSLATVAEEATDTSFERPAEADDECDRRRGAHTADRARVVRRGCALPARSAIADLEPPPEGASRRTRRWRQLCPSLDWAGKRAWVCQRPSGPLAA